MRTYAKLTLSMFLLFAFVISVNAQQEQYGQASYYSDAYHGKKTASGAKYDKNKLTCAHNDFPYGSNLRVTHLENKKSVVVKVTDRGPYIKGRIVDLSRAAAQKIGLIQDGVAQVKVELLSDKPAASETLASKGDKKVPDQYSTADSRLKVEESIKKTKAKSTSKSSPRIKGTAKNNSKKATSTAKTKADAKKEAAKNDDVLSEKGEDTPATSASLPVFTAQDMAKADLYKISLRKPKKAGYGVQVASFGDYENVLKKVAELQGKWFDNILIKTETAGGENVYKIVLGQYDTREQANSYKKDLKKKKKISGFVVALGEDE